ncbi:probable serine/threonine-protein kinase PIX13 isoform X2 [Olea europaea var. sylvestris]|uniref:probable serine/threonine-protein kinase PIX13 isoform X2 n=1 Tax=Olea europaea var. sylvestris TaxID=158386 RepID=UPI000C1CD04E|nr:probable serine/threonine-protein kinase PIX13 isoform X2 [Olea europaea var. sylvestris]
MSNNYDNWERLVVAVLRREKDRQLALAPSRESSISSVSSSFNFGLDFPVHEQSLQFEASSSKVNETDRERLFPSATSSSPGLSQFFAAASDDTCVSGERLPIPNLEIYRFTELKRATKNFKSEMMLWSGRVGTLFMGWMDSDTLAPSTDGTRMTVAIIKLNPNIIPNFGEWEREVNYLGRLSHPNFVKLLGYCWEDKERLLVYEFMQWGSLANHLYSSMESLANYQLRRSHLSWDIRLKIAIGAARGLDFLHTSDNQVVYRDFKSSSILLDGNYNAKIMDFFLARSWPSEENSYLETPYAAPEYVATGSHVLNIERPKGEQNLIDYAKHLSRKRKLMTIMDPSMEGEYSSKAALQAARLILRCLEPLPNKRPSMKKVVEELEQIAGETFGF